MIPQYRAPARKVSSKTVYYSSNLIYSPVLETQTPSEHNVASSESTALYDPQKLTILQWIKSVSHEIQNKKTGHQDRFPSLKYYLRLPPTFRHPACVFKVCSTFSFFFFPLKMVSPIPFVMTPIKAVIPITKAATSRKSNAYSNKIFTIPLFTYNFIVAYV